MPSTLLMWSPVQFRQPATIVLFSSCPPSILVPPAVVLAVPQRPRHRIRKFIAIIGRKSSRAKGTLVLWERHFGKECRVARPVYAYPVPCPMQGTHDRLST